MYVDLLSTKLFPNDTLLVHRLVVRIRAFPGPVPGFPASAVISISFYFCFLHSVTKISVYSIRPIEDVLVSGPYGSFDINNNYNLRKIKHDFVLPPKDDRNFFNRVLFK